MRKPLEIGSLVLITKTPCYDDNNVGVISRILHHEGGTKYVVKKKKSAPDCVGYYEVFLNTSEVEPIHINIENLYARYTEIMVNTLVWARSLYKDNPKDFAEQIMSNRIEKVKAKNAKGKSIIL